MQPPTPLEETENKNVLVLGSWSKELTSPHPSMISEVLIRNFMRLLDKNRLSFFSDLSNCSLLSGFACLVRLQDLYSVDLVLLSFFDERTLAYEMK
jgi:hypothetical protein